MSWNYSEFKTKFLFSLQPSILFLIYIYCKENEISHYNKTRFTTVITQKPVYSVAPH